MFDQITNTISNALDSVGQAADGAIEHASDAIASTTVSHAANLDAALARGNERVVRVELTALYRFYHDLKDVHVQLVEMQHRVSAQTGGLAMAGAGVADDLEQLVGLTIPGVHDALTAAHDATTDLTQGLAGVIKNLQNTVAAHMVAVYHTYLAYLEADRAGASSLSGAARSQINTDWSSLDTTVPAPTGFTPAGGPVRVR